MPLSTSRFDSSLTFLHFSSYNLLNNTSLLVLFMQATSSSKSRSSEKLKITYLHSLLYVCTNSFLPHLLYLVRIIILSVCGSRHENSPRGHPSFNCSHMGTLNCRVFMGSVTLTTLKRVVTGNVSTPLIGNA